MAIEEHIATVEIRAAWTSSALRARRRCQAKRGEIKARLDDLQLD